MNETNITECPAGPAGEDANLYNKIKIRISIVDIIITLLFITALAFSGISVFIVKLIEEFTLSPYIQFLVFLSVIITASGFIGFPLDFYSGYIIEHRFKLSNQKLSAWFLDKVKSLLVSLVLGLPVALAFYYFLRVSGDNWWFYFSLFIFIFIILMARIAPILIFPIFYKFSPLENSGVSEKIILLLNKNNIRIKGIYSFNMSKETKKANAGFTGIGKSKRIILSDTLLEKFTPEEIAVIFAHEVGHYKKRHVLKNILLNGIIIFASFYICGELYQWSIYKHGFINLYDIAAIPILMFYLTVFSLLIMPLSNIISRYHEREADSFAVEITRDKKSFISGMEKLSEINLADKEPNPVAEFLFYSHPSIKKRVDFAESLPD